MIKAGLTGGIGCGKSLVGRFFKQLGSPVIDADQIARELVEPGQAALDEIIHSLGADLTAEDGQLDRALLREKVFSDSSKLLKLESILHPRIRKEILKRMDDCEKSAAPYVIVDVPLLLEKGYQSLFDEIIVVDCTPEQQLERTGLRDKLPPRAIKKIINTQASREQRLEIASITLDNTGSPERLALQVKALHDRFIAQDG